MKRLTLWRYLWRWTLAALAVAWATLLVASYYAGLHEAQEITDANLASAVNVLLQVSAFGTQTGDPSALQIPAEREFQSFVPLGRHLNLARSLAVVVWDREVVVADSRPLDQRASVLVPNGYSTFTTQAPGAKKPHHWRVFAAERGDNERRAAAMIDMDQRSYIGRQVALTIAKPSLVVLPLVALLLWWAIRRGLQPLNALSARVAALKLQAGERLTVSPAFEEFTSMVTAINGLIDRLQAQADREHQFAADIAHELRTPLAAISLQARMALQEPDAQARAQALSALQRESVRAGNILQELLDLARAQRFGVDGMAEVPLQELAARVMASFAQSSFQSGHTLELGSDPAPVVVRANPMLLELALRNLISNALGHTCAGTLVRVTVEQNERVSMLSVSDNGVETAADGKTEPVGLAHNLGIGLFLVERIATMHRASLVRDTGEAPMSTRFSILWQREAFAA